MKTPFKTPIILLLVTIVLSVGLYYESSLKTISLNYSNSRAELQKSVNIVVNNMELLIHDDQGLHKAKLTAAKLQHVAQDNTTFLTSPSLIINQAKATWDIKSNTGSIFHRVNKIKQIDHILLANHVVIIRNESTDSNLPFMTLETNSISYYPDEDVMRTKDKVTITNKDSITTADGLEFYKKDQRLKLLKNVKTVYKAKANTLALKTTKQPKG